MKEDDVAHRHLHHQQGEEQDGEKHKRKDQGNGKAKTKRKKTKTKSKGNESEEEAESESVEEEEERSSTDDEDEKQNEVQQEEENVKQKEDETVQEQEEDEEEEFAAGSAPLGSGLNFFRRRRQRQKRRSEQEQRQREEKRQQLVKLKRLTDSSDSAPLHIELPAAAAAPRDVEFVTKRALLASSQQDQRQQQQRKQSLGSAMGCGGLWAVPSGYSGRRTMTESAAVGKASSSSSSCFGRSGLEAEASSARKRDNKKLRKLAMSAPATVLRDSDDHVEEHDDEDDDEVDEEDEDEEEDEEEEDEEEEEEDDGEDEEEDEDDERSSRYNRHDAMKSPAGSSASLATPQSCRLSSGRCPAARTVVLDIDLVEARDLLVLSKRAMRKLFKQRLGSPFFTVSVGHRVVRTPRAAVPDPTYPHLRLSFVYREGDDDTSVLAVKLFYRCRTKAHRTRRVHVGTAELPLADLMSGQSQAQHDQGQDLWLPIVPSCDYQLLWNWRPTKRAAADSRGRARLGSVRLRVCARVVDHNEGGSTLASSSSSNLLSSALSSSSLAAGDDGLPSLAVPLRLQVGDVILFHCSQFASHGAKLATRSRWDHVAMVAQHRHRPGLYLFEATRDGVHLFHLDRRLAFYLESRTELGVRRLRVRRTPEMEAALHDFVAEVDGRPYKTNPLELLRALRDSNESDNLDTIFCSQLVAAAYQRMGILPAGLCSNNYLPADFATAKIGDDLIDAELEEVVLVPPTCRPGGDAGSLPPQASGGSAPGSFQIGSFPGFPVGNNSTKQ